MQDNNFYTKLLFYINNRVQLYLQSCFYNKKQQGPTIRKLDFNPLSKMIQGHHFGVEFPLILSHNLAKFRRKNNTEGLKSKTKRKNMETPDILPIKRRRNKGTASNDNMHPQLILKPDKKYGATTQPYLKEAKEKERKSQKKTMGKQCVSGITAPEHSHQTATSGKPMACSYHRL